MRMRQFLFWVGCTLISVGGTTQHLSAQQTLLKAENQQWIQYAGRASLPHDRTFMLDAGFRWRQQFTLPAGFIVRGALGQSLPSGWRLAAGGGLWGFYQQETLGLLETRLHQEARYQHKWGNKRGIFRYRLEERVFWRRDPAEAISFDRVNLRHRFMLGMLMPLTQLRTRTLNFRVNLELLLSSGPGIQYNRFGQLRMLAGMDVPLSSRLGIRFTYHGQFRAVNSPGIYRYLHIAWIGLFHQIRG